MLQVGVYHVLHISAVGAVGQVDAVIVVAYQAQVPALHAVVEADAGCCQGRATLAHALVVAHIRLLLGAGAHHVGHVGVACVFGLGPGAEHIDVEGACHLEVQAEFRAVVVLLHPVEAVVGEGVLVVVVVVLPLGAVIGAGEVSGEVGAQPAAVVGVTQLGRGNLLVLEVTHEVVVHLGTLKGHAGLRRARLVAHAHAEGVALAQVERGAHLEAPVQEIALSALAITVSGAHAVVHVAVPPHLRAAHPGCDEVVADALVLGDARPQARALVPQVIVVAHAVALAYGPVGVVEVILHARVCGRVVTECICVHVVEVRSAQHVLHGGVVHALVGGELQSGPELGGAVDVPVKGASQVGHQVVVVLGLHPVHGVMPAGVELLVGVVELVPVDLAVALAGRPVVVTVLPGVPVGPLFLFPHVHVAAGEVLPVVGSGVLSVVVEFGAAVHRVLEERAGGQLHVVLYLEIPCEERAGLVVVHHAAVALLAVLVAPVGVVLAVIGQPVCLVGAGPLLCALCGASPGGEVQGVPVVDYLLQA